MTIIGIIASIFCIGIIIFVIKKLEVKGCTGNCNQGRCICDCRGKE